MSKFQLVALAGLFICAIDVAAAFAVDESAEPPLKYVVKVGGKTVTMSEGQPVRFEGSFTTPRFRLSRNRTECSLTRASVLITPRHSCLRLTCQIQMRRTGRCPGTI